MSIFETSSTICFSCFLWLYNTSTSVQHYSREVSRNKRKVQHITEISPSKKERRVQKQNALKIFDYAFNRSCFENQKLLWRKLMTQSLLHFARILLSILFKEIFKTIWVAENLFACLKYSGLLIIILWHQHWFWDG